MRENGATCCTTRRVWRGSFSHLSRALIPHTLPQLIDSPPPLYSTTIRTPHTAACSHEVIIFSNVAILRNVCNDSGRRGDSDVTCRDGIDFKMIMVMCGVACLGNVCRRPGTCGGNDDDGDVT